jgi:lysophospholipase L1-like esterase
MSRSASEGARRRAARRLTAVVALSATATVAVVLVATTQPASIAATHLVQPDPSVQPAAIAAQPSGRNRAAQLVVLGDSVASGAGCGCLPFGQLLASKLASAQGHTTPLTNAAQDGLTTRGLVEQLRRPDIVHRLATATLVTVTIGANDFDPDLARSADCLGPGSMPCYRERLVALGSLLRAALDRVRAVAPSSRIFVTGYWNVFLDGQIGRDQGSTYRQVSDGLTRAVNAVISQQALATGAFYVDLYSPFEFRSLAALTALLAADGDHPSASGHRLISDLLLRTVASTTRSG